MKQAQEKLSGPNGDYTQITYKVKSLFGGINPPEDSVPSGTIANRYKNFKWVEIFHPLS